MNGQQELNDALQRVVRPSQNYYDEILAWAKRFFIKKGMLLTSENISNLWALYHPDKKPLEPRVYGAVINRLRLDGKIRHVDYKKATNKQAHCRPISVWEVV